MESVVFQGALELAAMLRRREISSRELVDLFVARIEAQDGKLNAVVTRDFERARERAAQADEATARGASFGPLHGVPVTIKDSFETEGLRTTSGYVPLSAHVPTADAAGVARLRAAGVVILGKTNLPELAGDWQSDNAIFGRTNNPWDPARTPGGSSGGAAAALAAGFCGLELGSDIGGSIRIPAGWCGVYGHKPSFGIVSTRGHIPGPPGTLGEADLGVAGPMARTAEDLDLALGLLAGPLADRAVAWRLSLPAPRRASLREYRVAAWLDDPAAPVDAAVSARLHEMVSALRGAGIAVDEAARPAIALREAVDVYLRLLFPIILAGSPPELFDGLVGHAAAAPAGAQDAMTRMARYATERHREWLGANEARHRVGAALAAFFRSHDVLLLPLAGVAAIPHDASAALPARKIQVDGQPRDYLELASWISLATMTGHPATSAPIGRTADGLPVGVQIVGPLLEDRTPIDFAARLAALMGGFSPPPGFAA
jgi:amidase